MEDQNVNQVPDPELAAPPSQVVPEEPLAADGEDVVEGLEEEVETDESGEVEEEVEPDEA